MLLHDSRRAARLTPAGDVVLLDDQDRALWNAGAIAEGLALVQRALSSRRFGPYTMQAAIAAVHAEARHAAETDWPQIVGLYDVLLRADPSPVIELNRAAAIAMRDGPPPASRSSTPFSREAISRLRVRALRARGASAAPGSRRRGARRYRRALSLVSRNPSGGFSSEGWRRSSKHLSGHRLLSPTAATGWRSTAY